MTKNSQNQQNKVENPNFTFIINAQYLKDLSFENPKAPSSLRQFNDKPDIKVDVDIDSQQLKDHGEDIFEVELSIKATTSSNKETLFVVEGKYAGIFTIKNAPEEILKKTGGGAASNKENVCFPAWGRRHLLSRLMSMTRIWWVYHMLGIHYFENGA